jgi:hypothetical protein
MIKLLRVAPAAIPFHTAVFNLIHLAIQICRDTISVVLCKIYIFYFSQIYNLLYNLAISKYVVRKHLIEQNFYFYYYYYYYYYYYFLQIYNLLYKWSNK